MQKEALIWQGFQALPDNSMQDEADWSLAAGLRKNAAVERLLEGSSGERTSTAVRADWQL